VILIAPSNGQEGNMDVWVHRVTAVLAIGAGNGLRWLQSGRQSDPAESVHISGSDCRMAIAQAWRKFCTELDR
jgi:hypothetical protein